MPLLPLTNGITTKSGLSQHTSRVNRAHTSPISTLLSTSLTGRVGTTTRSKSTRECRNWGSLCRTNTHTNGATYRRSGHSYVRTHLPKSW